MSVRIEQVTLAKSQKSLRVSLSGKWYGAYLDSGLNEPSLIGQNIEAEIVTLDKGGPWIKTWIKTSAPQVSPPSPVVSPSGAPAAAEPRYAPVSLNIPPRYAEPDDNVQPWWMSFVSNTVAHAIAAGHCNSPEAINMWAMKAAQVAISVKRDAK